MDESTYNYFFFIPLNYHQLTNFKLNNYKHALSHLRSKCYSYRNCNCHKKICSGNKAIQRCKHCALISMFDKENAEK